MEVHAYNYTKLLPAAFNDLQMRAHRGQKPAYHLANGRVGFSYAKDTQRRKVYYFDAALRAQFPVELGRIMTLPEAQALCQRIFDDYGLDIEVDVRMGRRDKRGACAGLTEVVFGWGGIALAVETVLHEACHTVLKAYNLCDAHGPRFAALLCEVVYDYAGISRNYDLRQLGHKRKVSTVHQRDWRGFVVSSKTTVRTTTVKFAAVDQIPAPLWRKRAADRMAAGGVE